jgi:UDP-N-acetylglucosamine:LPS N-acetylglucosamine transferase
MDNKKILAVASIGGHWIQLLRIVQPLEQYYEVVYMSTHTKCETMVGKSKFHRLPDFSRWNAWRMLPASLEVFAVVFREKPSAIITTGAAPGLLTIFIGRLLGIKTIWVDSVANAQTMSACGRLACKFSNLVYTQWQDLATGRVLYAGNIFGD